MGNCCFAGGTRKIIVMDTGVVTCVSDFYDVPGARVKPIISDLIGYGLVSQVNGMKLVPTYIIVNITKYIGNYFVIV